MTTMEWKSGPPPERAGEWLVWIQAHGPRFARRDIRNRLFVLDNSNDHPAGWWEARITHHHPHPIAPPGSQQ